jgi:hypothetical protein
VEDAVRLPLAVGTYTHCLFIESLSLVETGVADTAFVFVDRHRICSIKDSSISGKLKQASVFARLEFHAGHRYNVVAGESGVWRSPV